jgi:UDP-GlcNAc3NAcA epimerase
MKVLTVVGARPQFIKAGPVSTALEECAITEILVHTGQHYDDCMSRVFFEELGLRSPDIHLGVGSGTHARQTAAMLCGLEGVIAEHRPNWVLIYGDTNSTLAGALAAAKLHVPVAHVESGLRSFNRRMPEEINRIVTDVVADLLLTPTATACTNLEREGVPTSRIRLVGDVMLDAALFHARTATQKSQILTTLGLRPKQYILATIHRAENTDDLGRLDCIVGGLAAIAKRVPVVWPVHPRARKALTQLGCDHEFAGLLRIEPAGYLDMLQLEQNAQAIVTDSGGVQKEAFFFGVPCVTVRDETEWVELVELGWNRLCPPVSAEALESAVFESLGRTGKKATPYGDGTAAYRIANELREFPR